jgi:hypothetical protein
MIIIIKELYINIKKDTILDITYYLFKDVYEIKL